ncbi:hypothetical protein DNTS_022335 [Danionella cerebrum]|uniref:SEFIR domain-containing protein n=1 Tax=Danionella cerebrum TaxID=2873325 RepID=A0A553N080_9TELE|nr:hypothetical protein DNTS_022335 [Danionella translucida]TRY58828.1 hypothetical protein DNTS_022335 [Danionella translucida]
MAHAWWMVNMLLLVATCASPLERVTHQDGNGAICPQELNTNCNWTNTNPLTAYDLHCGPVSFCSLSVKPKLCCYEEVCKPCLWSNIQLRLISDSEEEEDLENEGSESEENSGDWDSGFVSMPNNASEVHREYSSCEDQINNVTISICYKAAERIYMWCKRLDFAVTPSARSKPFNITLVEYEDVDFGRSMEVSVSSLKSECVPQQKPWISNNAKVSPYVYVKPLDGIFKVLLSTKEEQTTEPLGTCVKRGREGKCWFLPNNSIPFESATDCMCLQAWEKHSVRTEICPFENNKTEFKGNVLKNLTVTVALIKTNENQPMLFWTLAIPCPVRAELWPCHLQADGNCRELPGHPIKVDGKIERFCQHPVERQYWSVLILPLVIVCLAVVGGLLLVCKLRWSLREWDRTSHSQETKGQLLLLHSSTSDCAQVCVLARLLSELDFAVFLDLWSQAELGSLGPAAWLHSKLDHIQKHGGKALILLSPSTIQQAECYCKAALEDWINCGTSDSNTLALAMGCIYADRQKCSTAQRFVLVQMDSADNFKQERDLPKLLRGLPLYKLPLQTQGLLMELCLEKPNSVSGKLKKMWWMKRARSKLAQGVQNFCKKTRVRTESLLTQTDSLSLDIEDTEERVSLATEH